MSDPFYYRIDEFCVWLIGSDAYSQTVKPERLCASEEHLIKFT